MKHLRALLPGLLLLASAVPCLAGPALMGIDPVFTGVNVGDSLNITVQLLPNLVPPLFPGDGNSVAGYQFDLLFPTFVQVTGVTEDGYFASAGCCFGYGSIDNINGVISGISDIAFPGLTSLDDLVTITFTAVAPGTGSFSFQNSFLSDENGNALQLIVQPAVVLVQTPTGDGGTGNGPAPTPEPASVLLLGSALVVLGCFRRRARA